MKDYSGDAQDAYDQILEEGTLATLEWQGEPTTDYDSGEQTEGADMTAAVAVVVLPAGGGDRYENGVQVRNFRRKFYAAPQDPTVEVLDGRHLVIEGQRYNIESSAPLQPSGGARILWEGTLRIGG